MRLIDADLILSVVDKAEQDHPEHEQIYKMFRTVINAVPTAIEVPKVWVKNVTFIGDSHDDPNLNSLLGKNVSLKIVGGDILTGKLERGLNGRYKIDHLEFYKSHVKKIIRTE